MEAMMVSAFRLRLAVYATFAAGSALASASPALGCGMMMLEEDRLRDDPPVADDSQPYVLVTPPKVEGGASKAVDRQTVAAGVSEMGVELGYCFDDLLRRSPNAVTETNLRVAVGKNGNATSASLGKTALSIRDVDFEACLKAAALSFHGDAGRAYAFTTSVRFAPPMLAEVTPKASKKRPQANVSRSKRAKNRR
jgi:hypothetical protein